VSGRPESHLLNDSTPAWLRTLLVQLVEECNEVQKPALKALRSAAGLDGSHPQRLEEGTYRRQLTEEIGDVLAIVETLTSLEVLDRSKVLAASLRRVERLKSLTALARRDLKIGE